MFSTFLFFCDFLSEKSTKNGSLEKRRKTSPPGLQNGPKSAQNSCPKSRKSAKWPPKSEFWEVDFLMIFGLSKKHDFCRFWVPKLKGGIPLFGCFFDIFHVFSSFGCFPRFWVIFHGQGDQKCRKNDEKTSITTNLFTSSYHQPTHDILFIFPVNGKLKRPFPMNGRAVFPALPAQL